MRCAEMRGCAEYGIERDIEGTGNGLIVGIYPAAGALIPERAAGWPGADGFGDFSTSGGVQPGCIVAMKTLSILQRQTIRQMERFISN